MTAIDFAAWADEVRALVAELAAQDLAYPIGANVVRDKSRSPSPAASPPASPPPALPPQLVALYTACDGLSLPDVHAGYFLDAADRVATAQQRGEPTFVADSRMPIHVFGSDGGGGRFALGLTDGAVYHLPSSGAVEGGAFFADRAAPVRQLAPSVAEFLERLKRDVAAFVSGAVDHEFMTASSSATRVAGD